MQISTFEEFGTERYEECEKAVQKSLLTFARWLADIPTQNMQRLMASAARVLMNDSNQYILGLIKTHVWSGFYSEEEVYQMIEDVLDEDADEELLRAAVRPEFKRKKRAEAAWAQFTDCDRLDDAFAELNESGIVALHNTGMTQSDGLDDVSQALHERGREGITGYCFYHGQDLERAVNGEGLWLAFGGLDEIDEQKKALAEQIKDCLERHGLTVQWNGDPKRRLFLPKLDWKRRGPPNAT